MCHLYASLIPEALIVSMLPPEEFGAYYACGTTKRSREQAIFFELDPAFRQPFFRLEDGLLRCVPHEDGSPKRSIYVSVYRVLEHISLQAIQKLYLVTQDGRSLALEPSTTIPADGNGVRCRLSPLLSSNWASWPAIQSVGTSRTCPIPTSSTCGNA